MGRARFFFPFHSLSGTIYTVKIIGTFFLSLFVCGYAAPLDMEVLLDQAGENSGEVEKFIGEAEAWEKTSFLEPEDGTEKEPEKKMPSTTSNAMRLSAKKCDAGFCTRAPIFCFLSLFFPPFSSPSFPFPSSLFLFLFFYYSSTSTFH